MNVSPNFSPPIKMMQVYFLLSSFFYLLSMLWLFFIDPLSDLRDFSLIGWVHLYMLGFVMMGIFSAMAQLAPIVVESAHYEVKIFKYLWIFLLSGLLLMIVGFYHNPIYLLYGGSLVFLAMFIYAVEFLLTIKNSKRKTSITKAMKMSNFFLLLGIITGLVMAASFNGYIAINPHTILNIHTFGLVVGFVILLIMGISIILIPMFGSSTRISDNEFTNSFHTIALGVIVMMLSPFFYTALLENLSYIIVSASMLLYFYQLYKMTKSRKRLKHDIWAKSMYIAFSSFIISFYFLLFYLYTNDAGILKLAMWILFIGFFGFVIIGNFYKVLPFLIWFHIYSPLIEEQAVPMLHQLLPNRLATLQWFFSSLGLVASSVGLYTNSLEIFHAGVLLLATASLIFFIIIIKLLKVKI